jgi:alpha/beta superfamily hydrolase
VPPHPLFHGANTNKVAHTLARIFRDLGYAALRPNFRGVGKSEGSTTTASPRPTTCWP